jgi:hypothetical protein
MVQINQQPRAIATDPVSDKSSTQNLVAVLTSHDSSIKGVLDEAAPRQG